MSDPIDIDDIDMAYLDHQAEIADQQWKEIRLEQLITKEARRLGHDYMSARIALDALETECANRTRAMRAQGLSLDEIADMFRVSRELIDRWAGEVT